MRLKRILCLTLAITLAGCVPFMTESRNGKFDTVFSDIVEAAKTVPPLITMKKGQDTPIKISTEKSPKLKRDNATDSFEVVSLTGKKDEAFTIQLGAICDCLGFRKWSAVPVPLLISPNGTQVTFSQEGETTAKIIRGTFPMDGEYKLIVIADTSLNNRVVGRAMGYDPATYSQFSVSITAHPEGTVIVWWKQE